MDSATYSKKMNPLPLPLRNLANVVDLRNLPLLLKKTMMMMSSLQIILHLPVLQRRRNVVDFQNSTSCWLQLEKWNVLNEMEILQLRQVKMQIKTKRRRRRRRKKNLSLNNATRNERGSLWQSRNKKSRERRSHNLNNLRDDEVDLVVHHSFQVQN